MLFTSLPSAIVRNSFQCKVHLYVSFYNIIEVFSCLFRDKGRTRVAAAPWGWFCFLKGKTRGNNSRGSVRVQIFLPLSLPPAFLLFCFASLYLPPFFFLLLFLFLLFLSLFSYLFVSWAETQRRWMLHPMSVQGRNKKWNKDHRTDREPCEAQDEGIRPCLRCPLLVSVLKEDQSNDVSVVAARNPT